jgi:integrase
MTEGTMRLTEQTVRTIKLPDGKNDIIVFDGRLQGFGLRLRRGANGIKKTWIVQYRDAGGESRRFLIGTVDELSSTKAREVAADKLAGIRLGNYPHAEREKARDKAADTFEAIGKLYLANRQAKLRERSFAEVKRHVEKLWVPFARKSIHSIDRRMIALRLTEMAAENGPTAANRARSTLSALFTWAMREGIVETNPVTSTNRAADEVSRDRVLTDVELVAMWAQCREDDYGRIVRLLALTGQRREEVGGMLWSELDLERGTWTLAGARTKNKMPHVVPLAPKAIEIIKSAPRRASERVFGEGSSGNGFMGWAHCKAMLDQRITAVRGQEAGPIAHWRLHDIRRTVATGMAELGVEPHIVEAVLNHRSGHKSGVAGTYNRAAYERQVRAALLLWADHVQSIISGAERKVIPMRAATQLPG